jgi:hypothetical protein
MRGDRDAVLLRCARGSMWSEDEGNILGINRSPSSSSKFSPLYHHRTTTVQCTKKLCSLLTVVDEDEDERANPRQADRQLCIPSADGRPTAMGTSRSAVQDTAPLRRHLMPATLPRLPGSRRWRPFSSPAASHPSLVVCSMLDGLSLVSAVDTTRSHGCSISRLTFMSGQLPAGLLAQLSQA